VSRLQRIARQARLDILDMSLRAKAGHVPSALSMVDYMTVVFDRLTLGRDRILLGKPFGAQAYYALLAGFAAMERDWDRYGTAEPGWTYIMDRRHPLVHFIDDSMGNALGVACGVALGCDERVYVNMSDAALQAGTVWEAIAYAAARRLDNLVVTVDHNDMQVLGKVSDINPVEPLERKLDAFGWRVLRCDGHDMREIENAVDEAFSRCDRPSIVVFDTTKGKGVPFIEGDATWHYRKLDDQTYAEAVRSLQ
jgi:transketolase